MTITEFKPLRGSNLVQFHKILAEEQNIYFKFLQILHKKIMNENIIQ